MDAFVIYCYDFNPLKLLVLDETLLKEKLFKGHY